MKKKWIKVSSCYVTTVKSKNVNRLTQDAFNKMITSVKIKEILRQIRKILDDSDLSDKEKEDKYKELKQQLPAILFMARFPEDGVRPTKDTAMPTGLCFHDFDHLEGDLDAIRKFYEDKVKAHEEEWNIVLAHITPSGHGLRLVTVLPEKWQIKDWQEYVALELGLQQQNDKKTFDVTRLSFMVSDDYILYINKEKLFDLKVAEGVANRDTLSEPEVANHHPAPETTTTNCLGGSKTSVVKRDGGSSKEVTNRDTLSESTIPNWESASKTTIAKRDGGSETSSSNQVSVLLYDNHIPFSRIAQELEKRVATLGLAEHGERNNTLYTTALHLRPITQSNFDITLAILQPIYSAKGLDDAEIRSTIASALGATRKNSQKIGPVLASVLTDLRVEYNVDENAEMRPQIPQLGKFYTELTSLFPEFLTGPVLLASLPILGTYSTNVRFDDTDLLERSTTFLTHVMAPPASCKSYTNHLKNVLFKRLKAEDMKALEEEEQERQARVSKGDQEKAVYKEHCVRILASTSTSAAIFQRLYQAHGKHVFLGTDEIGDITKKGSSYVGDFHDLDLHSFDNSEISKDTQGDASANVRLKVFMNQLTCGTNKTTMAYYKSAEDGLVTRTIFIPLPDTLGQRKPRYLKPTPEQEAYFDEVIDMLEHVEGKLKLPLLDKQMDDFVNEESLNQYLLDGDEIKRRLSFRAADMGLRAGYLTWLIEGMPDGMDDLEGTPSEACQRVLDFAMWVCKEVLYQQYTIFGDRAEAEIEAAAIKPRSTKVKNLFASLPDTFTISDITRTRIQLGMKATSNPSNTTTQWEAQGWVKKTDAHTWQKLPYGIQEAGGVLSA